MKFSVNLAITNRASQVFKWFHKFNENLPIQIGFENHSHNVHVTGLIWKSWDDSKIIQTDGKSKGEALNRVWISKQHLVSSNFHLAEEVSEASPNFWKVFKLVNRFRSEVTHPEILSGIDKFCARAQIMEKFSNYGLIRFWLIGPGDD